jgi:hypothetical protein
MEIGEIKNNSVKKFLYLYIKTLNQRSIPAVKEIMQDLECCIGTAYTYRRALRIILPETLPPKPTIDQGKQQNIANY